MSLNSVINRNNYLGTNLLTTYSYGFKIFSEDDLKVVVRVIATGVETVLTKTTDYTVTGVGSTSGGTIVLVNSGQAWLTTGYLKSQYALSIRRYRELKQSADFKNQGDFYPEMHETAFDKAMMIDQQQQDELNRAVKFPSSVDPTTFNPELPATLVGMARRTFITNDAGSGFIPGPTDAEILAAQGFSVAADASAQAAAASEANALSDAGAAEASAAAAATSEANAAQSATDAATSAAAAANSLDLLDDEVQQAQDARDEAQVAQAAAVTAKNAAETAATVAAGHEFDANSAKTQAEFAQGYAEGYAVDAQDARDAAQISETNAAASAATATTKAAEATAAAAAITGGFTVQRFDGPGTVFTLSGNPGSVNNTDLVVGGVPQLRNSYTIVGTTLTLSQAAPALTDAVEIKFGSAAPIGTPSDATVDFNKLTTDVQTRLSGSQQVLLNSNFDFWQRGTSTTITNGGAKYLADRWMCAHALGTNGVVTYSRVAGSGVNGSKYAAQIQITTAPTAAFGTSFELFQPIDNLSSLSIYNKTVSTSFRIKALGNVNSVRVHVYYQTSEALGSLGTIASQTFTVNSSNFTTCKLENFSIGTSMTTAGIVGYSIQVNGVSSGNLYALNNGIIAEQPVISVGATAAPFNRACDSIASELIACQRFYQGKLILPVGVGSGTANWTGAILLPVEMRAAPVIALTGAITITNGTVNINQGGAAISNGSTPTANYINPNLGSFSGLTGTAAYAWVTTGQHITADAEIGVV